MSGVYIHIFTGALCYLELALMLKKSGGLYINLYESWGGPVAFLYKWINTVVTGPAGTALQMLSLARYATGPFYPGCEVPTPVLKLAAATCTCKYNFFRSSENSFADNLFTAIDYMKYFREKNNNNITYHFCGGTKSLQ